jgi:c-di-GMP-binding flagellar brake protein YcgR
MVSTLPEKDRRIFQRRPLNKLGKIKIYDKAVSIRVIDISLGGIGFVANLNLPQGNAFQVEFTIPEGVEFAAIKTQIRIMNSCYSKQYNGFRVGAEFLELDSLSEKLIALYL